MTTAATGWSTTRARSSTPTSATSRTTACRTFSGPDGTPPRCWRCTSACAPLFAPLQRQLVSLRLSGRGSWLAELDDGATIEMGRGSDDELVARTERFVRTVGGVSCQVPEPNCEYADLRHTDGYAVRLRGVTTPSAASAPKKAR